MSQDNIQIISAGAGSGKTYTLTHRMLDAISGGIRISGLIATTFTEKAASELQHKVRELLLEKGLFSEANALSEAMIGTVHSIGVKLLRRFAFEAGVSPEVSVLAAEDAQQMFNSAFSAVISQEKIDRIDALASRLGKNKKEDFDWRKEIRSIADIARLNDFNAAVLQKSKINSCEALAKFFPPQNGMNIEELSGELERCLAQTIEQLSQNGDTTKVTADVVAELKKMLSQLRQHRQLDWYQWARLGKLNPGTKSRADMESLHSLAARHASLPAFQKDINDYICAIFDAAIEAITEFQEYKKKRGLIDYTDMEVLVKRLLQVPAVCSVLENELDLLMVDEFQDTSPLQLDNFLRLSRLAAKSIWVGDPKQSIYGFRGADPRLMQAIIEKVGISDSDILKKSYRSRKKLVMAVNAVFSRAFKNIPADLIPLEPPHDAEDARLAEALMHWHFRLADPRGQTTKGWLNHCIAHSLRDKLSEGVLVRTKDKTNPVRKAVPGDVAILCRTNYECTEMAAALHSAGLKAAISRYGLMETSEVQLVVACLKYMLQQSDALAVAEILRLANNMNTGDIIVSRLDYLAQVGEDHDQHAWANEDRYIAKINKLREKSRECAASEMLLLIVEELELRRVVMTWGNVQQRLANLDLLQKMVVDYESACSRKNAAASLGGFLLWLNEMASEGQDIQAASESPDSVNVLTYHKSKGLEWPIVICHALESDLSDNVWAMRIISEDREFDLSRPLEKRWLQFWVNPYADQVSGTPLSEKIKESEYKRQVDADALEEETRLMYVGMTRASDYMVFPTRQKQPKWLNRVCMDDEEIAALDPEKNSTDWEWNNEVLSIQSQIFSFEKEFEEISPEVESFSYYPERAGHGDMQSYYIDVEAETPTDQLRKNVQLISKICAPLKGSNEASDYHRMKVAFEFHRSLASQAPQEKQEQILQQMLARNELASGESAEMLPCLAELADFLNERAQNVLLQKNYPLVWTGNDRKFESQADVFAETAEGMLLLKLETYAGEREIEKAQSLLKWAYWAEKALKSQLRDGQKMTILVLFVASGNIYELA
jgi:ATP-dependent exoDNAse (exonuclease V) beta subunit